MQGTCCEHLQRFCPSFQSSISLPWGSQRLNPLRPFLLANSITTTSLDLFCRSFLGCATEIWNTTKLDDIRSNVCQSWTKLASDLQHIICNVTHLSTEQELYVSTFGKGCISHITLLFKGLIMRSTQMRIDADSFGATTMAAHHSVGLFTQDIIPSLSMH